MGKLIAVVAGLLIALVLPRWPRAVLTGAALLLGLVATVALAAQGWPVLAVAPAAGAAFFLLLWSARRWPRLLVFLLLLPGFVLPVFSAVARSAGRPAAVGAALFALALALLGAVKREGGLRLALGGLGAALAVMAVLPGEQRWALLPAMAVLFWLSSRLSPRWPSEPAGGLTAPVLAFVLVAGPLLALPWLFRDLSVPSGEPHPAGARGWPASRPRAACCGRCRPRRSSGASRARTSHPSRTSTRAGSREPIRAVPCACPAPRRSSAACSCTDA